MRQNIADRWESIKTTISDKAGEAKDSLVSKWRESQRKTAEWNESIRQNASDKWDEISKSIGDKASDIKTSITDAFTNAKTKATDIFGDLKTGITDKLESAREMPVAAEVDVFVAGGTAAGVAAARAAREKGATVFLASGVPYVGDDVAGASTGTPRVVSSTPQRSSASARRARRRLCRSMPEPTARLHEASAAS